jgi:hypothetical protein
VNRRSIAQQQRRERGRQERELQNFSSYRQESTQQTVLLESSVNQVLDHEMHMPAPYVTPPTTQDTIRNAVINPVCRLVPAPPIQHDQSKLIILAYNVATFLVLSSSSFATCVTCHGKHKFTGMEKDSQSTITYSTTHKHDWYVFFFNVYIPVIGD